MRIKVMTIDDELDWYFDNFFPLLLWEMCEGTKWEVTFWSVHFIQADNSR